MNKNVAVGEGQTATFTIEPDQDHVLTGATVSCEQATGSMDNLGKLTVSNVTKTQKCTVTLRGKEPSFIAQLKKDNPTIHTRDTGTFGSAFTGEGGLYQETDSKYLEDDGKTQDVVYYFSGNATNMNNWVKFGKEGNSDIWWRIIRTNEDGSVRLLYAGTSSSTEQGYINNTTSKYNDSYNNTRYVGYMYGNAGDLTKNRENKTDSTIKGVIDSWYTTNMTKNDDQSHSYGSYLSRTAVYCNDRATSSYNASSTMYYAGYYRLSKYKRPSFKCGNNEKGELYTGETGGADTADRFTASNKSNVGNQKLTYPVALMTADEVSYAGGVYGSNSENTYYYKNSNGGSVTGSKWWWTMSPFFYVM